MVNNFSLSQKFYLLQQKNLKNSRFWVISNSEMYSFGAILLELRVLNKIEIVRRGIIKLINEDDTGVKYLDSVINFLKINHGKNLYDIMYRYSYNQYDTAKKEIAQSVEDYLDKNSVENIVDSLRAELLEPGEVSDTNKALILLLDTSNYDVKLSKKFFSEFEQNTLNIKLNEIKAQKNDLTKDLIAITEKYKGGFKDFFISTFASLNPMNLMWLNSQIPIYFGPLIASFLLSVFFTILGIAYKDYPSFYLNLAAFVGFLLLLQIPQKLFKISTNSRLFRITTLVGEVVGIISFLLQTFLIFFPY